MTWRGLLTTVRIALGTVISVAAVAFSLTAGHHLVRAASCSLSNGGVATPTCPTATATWMYLIPGALAVGLVGRWLAFGWRRRLVAWLALVGGLGVAAIVALHDDSLPSGRHVVLLAGVGLIALALAPVALLGLLALDGRRGHAGHDEDGELEELGEPGYAVEPVEGSV